MTMKNKKQHEEELATTRFDRNLRIVAGVVSVLGVAATTLMTIMEAEKSVRSRMKKAKKGKVLLLKSGKPKLPPKKKAARYMPKLTAANLKTLERLVNKTLDQAKELEEEIREDTKNESMSNPHA